MQITFMKASVRRSERPPSTVAQPCSCSAMLQIPCASSPCSSATAKVSRSAVPPSPGSSSAVTGSKALRSGDWYSGAKPGKWPSPAAAAARAASRAREAQSASASSSSALVAARPTWPRKGVAISTV